MKKKKLLMEVHPCSSSCLAEAEEILPAAMLKMKWVTKAIPKSFLTVSQGKLDDLPDSQKKLSTSN